MPRRVSLPLLLLLTVAWGACGEDAPPAPLPRGASGSAPPEASGSASPEAAARAAMVQNPLERRGVEDPAVLGALRTVPRHLFVPLPLRPHAYEDRPLAIGWDQTISQPYIVASMTEEAHVEPGSRVLEIGTGSGYQAAVLAEITPHVFSIEIKPSLAKRAAHALREAGYETVKTREGDGYDGWPEEAPFDAILVTAAAPHVPPPLVRQLKLGGRMVIPVGSAFAVQDLVLVTKDEDGTVRTHSLYAVRFVPLTGSLGASED